MNRYPYRPSWIRAATLSVLFAFAAAGCASPSAPPPAPPLGAYRVGPPDVLNITILPEPLIERESVVRPDGMISVDLIGDIAAGGRTTEEIAADIQTRIGRFKRDARVTVALGAALSSEITVLGEVARPSTFPLTRQTRVIESIGTVGGPTIFAAQSRIRIIRFNEGTTRVLIANLDAIQEGDLSTNFLLHGGDLVVVPPSTWAKVGYALQSALFPFQQIIGFGARVSTTVFTGGI
jgi:polysaccharide export outer membrane protein